MLFTASVPVRSLYIHWPFCPYKCHFCPFVALAGHDSFMHQYHQALVAEICTFAKHAGRLTIETIFFGGGTPSTYPNDLLLDMFGTLNNVFDLTQIKEITLEVNPGTVTIPEQLFLWRSIGINRLSIGVQSLNDEVLKKLNRHQKALDVYALIETATPLFDVISIDLILGLPGIEIDDWKDLLMQVVTWPIKHISLYFLTVHEDTALYFRVKKKQITLHTDEHMVDLYHWSCQFLASHGFVQYEMSNFARQEKECLHNKVYWERKPYKGFGLGACSFDGMSRFENEKKLPIYLQRAHGAMRDVVAHAETLTPKQVRLEQLMLGLRRAKGICLDELLPLVDGDRQRVITQINLLTQEQLIQEIDGVFSLTPKGLVVENEIVVTLW